MKIILIALMIGLSCADEADDTNPLKLLEELNVEEFAKDEVFIKSVFACLLAKKPCQDLQYLKDGIPAVIASKCKECNEKQKANFQELHKVLKDKYPEDYNRLIEKYSVKN